MFVLALLEITILIVVSDNSYEFLFEPSRKTLIGNVVAENLEEVQKDSCLSKIRVVNSS